MIDTSKPVRVFRNWKRGCFSIMQGGLLKASARSIRLRDVEFLVRASGRERMVRQQRKNVHAYAIGHLEDFVQAGDQRIMAPLGGRGFLYDAYRFETFVDAEDHSPVHGASMVQFDDDGATYLNTPTFAEAA